MPRQKKTSSSFTPKPGVRYVHSYRGKPVGEETSGRFYRYAPSGEKVEVSTREESRGEVTAYSIVPIEEQPLQYTPKSGYGTKEKVGNIIWQYTQKGWQPVASTTQRVSLQQPSIRTEIESARVLRGTEKLVEQGKRIYQSSERRTSERIKEILPPFEELSKKRLPSYVTAPFIYSQALTPTKVKEFEKGYIKGVYEGVREQPLKAGLTAGAFFILPGTGKIAKTVVKPAIKRIPSYWAGSLEKFGGASLTALYGVSVIKKTKKKNPRQN